MITTVQRRRTRKASCKTICSAMPAGSPSMETDGAVQPYQVIGLTHTGVGQVVAECASNQCCLAARCIRKCRLIQCLTLPWEQGQQ